MEDASLDVSVTNNITEKYKKYGKDQIKRFFELMLENHL